MAEESEKNLLQKALDGKIRIHEAQNGGDLSSKFAELYNRSSSKCSNVFRPSNLLKKFVNEYKPNRLVVELFPEHVGYSVSVINGHGVQQKIADYTYRDDTLLRYVDAEQLVPCLLEHLRKFRNLFYDWSVIVEIRDFRNGNFLSCDPRFVRLEPTTESILQFAKLIMRDKRDITQEKSNRLEAVLLLCTAQPVCPNPSPQVALLANRLQHMSNVFSSKSTNQLKRRRLHKVCETIVEKNKKAKFEKTRAALSSDLSVVDFIASKSASAKHIELPENSSLKTAPKVDFEINKLVHQLNLHDIAKVMEENVPKNEWPGTEDGSKLIALGRDSNVNLRNRKIVRDEYLLELLTEDFPADPTILQSTQVEITRFPVEEQYCGKLSVNYFNNNQSSSSEFLLGSKTRADRFVNKFIEVFTEEDSRMVKKSHKVPGQKTVTTYSEKVIEKMKEQM